MIRADGGRTTRKGLDVSGSSGSHGYPKHSGRKKSRDPESVHHDSIAMGNFHPGDKQTQTATISARGRGAESDGDSQSSQSKIIRKTVGWTVTEEKLEPQMPPHDHTQ